MPTCTRPAADFTPEQHRLPPMASFTVRPSFAGGEVPLDIGALLVAAADRRIGLIDRLTAAITDYRNTRYVIHPLRDLLSLRTFQIASCYEDGNDANKALLWQRPSPGRTSSRYSILPCRSNSTKHAVYAMFRLMNPISEFI